MNKFLLGKDGKEYMFWNHVIKHLGRSDESCRRYVNMKPKVKVIPLGNGHFAYRTIDIYSIKNWLDNAPIVIERYRDGRFKKTGRKKR